MAEEEEEDEGSEATWAWLPLELLWEICKFWVTPKQVFMMCSVCSQWREGLSHESLWRCVHDRHFGGRNKEQRAWKEQVKNQVAHLSSLHGRDIFQVILWAGKKDHYQIVERLVDSLAKSYPGFLTTTKGVNEGKKLLIKACRYNSHRVLSHVLDRGQQLRIINTDTPVPCEALSVCIDRQSVDCMRLLLAYSAIPPCRTFLVDAAAVGSIPIVSLLLDKGVNFGMSCGPLLKAIAEEHSALACYLIDRGSPIGEANSLYKTPLCHAVSRQLYDVVEALLAKGSDVATGGAGALTIACSTGHLGMVRLLLEKGASFRSEDGSYRIEARPMIVACRYGYTDVVGYLLDKAPQLLNHVDRAHGTPLHVATRSGQLEAAKLLVTRGAEVDKQNEEGCTPLHTAVRCDREEVAKYLLEEAHASTERRNERGETPLEVAARFGLIKLVKLLVKAGLQRPPQQRHRSALHLAALCAHSEAHIGGICNRDHSEYLKVLRVLLRKRVVSDVNGLDEHGRTALGTAVRMRHMKVAMVLIEGGADVNAGECDNTPLSWAIKNEDKDMEDYLRAVGATCK